MNVKSCYKIGFVMKPHGLKGEVTVALDTEAPLDFASVETIFVETNGQLLPFFVESVSMKGSKAFVKLEEVDNRDQAEKISKSFLFLPRSKRPRLKTGEFYDDEIIGFHVTDTALGDLGRITEVVHAGGNRLLSVDHGGREVLVPLNSPFIDTISKSTKKITVTLPAGFLEI